VLDVSGPIPQQFTGDPTALRQVLINLVGNAVKFTSQGSVTLQVQIGSTELPSLGFHVIDTGPGMTQEQQDRLFKPFIQADNSITRKYGGTGLGLAISQKLAGLMEGKITLASQPGQGTTFSFHLPISTFDADSASAAITNPTAPPPMMIGSFDAKPLTGLRILYADDMPDNRALLKHLLGKLGATPTVVDGGQAAIDLVRTGSTFDIILLDVQMPDLNGYDTTRALRQMGSTLPIFALTAHALPEDRQRCLAAGCDDYLTKPVDVSKLVAACLARTNTNKQAA